MLLAMLSFNLVFTSQAWAVTFLSKPSVLLTNMNSGGASSLIVMFTTSASNTGTNGSLVFTGWTGAGGTGTVATAQTVATSFGGTNCTVITGAASNLPGAPTAAGTAGTGTIAITDATALVASTSYCYVLSGNAITANPTATGQSNVAVTAGSDSATNTEIDIISNDQVVVGATVPPSFTFALSGNTDNFTTNLSTGATATTTGITATVNTNAKNGWFMYGSDATTGLRSVTQSKTIASTTPGANTTLVNGSEGYISAVPTASIVQGSGAGVTSATGGYASTGAGNGSGLDTTVRQMASSTGTANGASVIVKEYATIAPTTPAALDYGDTITLVAAGSF
jgi:hypothetical protein